MKKMKINVLAFMSVLLTVCIFFSITVSAAATEDTYTFIVPGDVDCNRFLEITDVTLIQKHLASVENITEAGLSVADYNGDGVSNILDATEMQKCLAGMSYKCWLNTDENYLVGGNAYYYEKPNSGEIDFKLILDADDAFYIGREDSGKAKINTDISLITSKEQFFAFMGCYSPNFDDEFFEDNALIMWVSEYGLWPYDKSIEQMFYNDGVLYVNALTFNPEYKAPSPTFECVFYKVNKADISGVKEMPIEMNYETYA